MSELGNFDDLDDLLGGGERGSAESNIIKLAYDQIYPDPEQPRKEFDEEKIKALAASLDSQGQLNEITVSSQGSDGKYMLEDGERRWRALPYCNKLEFLEAKVNEKTPTEEGEKLIRQYHHNQFAEKLSDEEVMNIVEKLSPTRNNRQLAKDLVRSESTISQCKKILTMPDEVRSLMSDGVVDSIRTLYAIAVAYETNSDQAMHFINSVRQEGGVTYKKADTFRGMLKEQSKSTSAEEETQQTPSAESAKGEIEAQEGEVTTTDTVDPNGETFATPVSKTPTSESAADETYEISNVRVSANGREGYLITVHKSVNGQGKISFDDNTDELEEVSLSKIVILEVE